MCLHAKLVTRLCELLNSHPGYKPVTVRAVCDVLLSFIGQNPDLIEQNSDAVELGMSFC